MHADVVFSYTCTAYTHYDKKSQEAIDWVYHAIATYMYSIDLYLAFFFAFKVG